MVTFYQIMPQTSKKTKGKHTMNTQHIYNKWKMGTKAAFQNISVGDFALCSKMACMGFETGGRKLENAKIIKLKEMRGDRKPEKSMGEPPLHPSKHASELHPSPSQRRRTSSRTVSQRGSVPALPRKISAGNIGWVKQGDVW